MKRFSPKGRSQAPSSRRRIRAHLRQKKRKNQLSFRESVTQESALPTPLLLDLWGKK